MRASSLRIRHAKPRNPHLVSGAQRMRLKSSTATALINNHHHTAAAKSLIDTILPRSRFASSVFTTPILLLLRLFYQATSFDHYDVPPAPATPRVTIRELLGKLRGALRSSQSSRRNGSETQSQVDGLLDISAKTSTDSWHRLIKSGQYAISQDATVLSMTWIKSLSAPLSHEFLQFVIECKESGRQYRLITERDCDGDAAYFMSSASLSKEETEGITQLRQYDYQHDLPLPLLSASWSHLPSSRRPTLLQLAANCERTSNLCPEYNFLRQHCWWYAEKLFEQMLEQPQSDTTSANLSGSEPHLKHWPWGGYRYSYIVLGKRYLRRDVLIDQAKRFRQDMDHNDRLHW